MPSKSLWPQERLYSGDVSAFKAESLKTQMGKGTELQVPIWHSVRCKAFLIHMGSALEPIEKEGYFKAQDKANNAYMEQHKHVKQAKASLAKLDGTTSKGTGSSEKPSKKHKDATATAGQPNLDLQAEYQSDLKKAKDTAEKAKAKAELAAQEMFQLTQTCCLLTPSTRGTKLSRSTHNLRFPGKDPGDMCASHLTTA
jgi:hypothetical protein